MQRDVEGGQSSGAARRGNPGLLARVVLGVAALAVSVWVAATRRDVLGGGHPAYLVLVVLVGLVGIVLLASLGRARARRPGRWRRVRAALGSLGVVALLGATAWLRPFGASPTALQAMSSTAEVTVSSTATTITLWPARPSGAGLVFQPGARVDPRAYVGVLTPVAAAGHLVVIVKQPLGIALLASGASRSIIAEYPQVRAWAVGGHSLGGVVAAQDAAADPGRVRGLVLWAAYPVSSLAGRTDLAVTSVSGSADALATPQDIAAHRADLPPDTRYAVIDGAVHAYFGDYGEQPGDGIPTTDRAGAQHQIARATIDLLDRLARP